MVNIVTLTDEEHKKAIDLWAEHGKKCGWANGKKYAGAIGGCQSWRAINTSIGQIVSIKCTCGWEKTVTDLDSL